MIDLELPKHTTLRRWLVAESEQREQEERARGLNTSVEKLRAKMRDS